MSKYKKISNNIQTVVIDNPKTNDKLVWLNINNAGKKEIEYLRKNYKFNLSHLQASSAKILAQRPSFTVNNDANYVFLILHFPIVKNGEIVSGEIDFFIKHRHLTTIHNNNIPALNKFFNLYKKDGETSLSYEFESASVLLYELLKKLMSHCYVLLDKNSVEISKIEKIIFTQKQKQAVSEILDLRRDIINFRKIMQSHKNILKKLMEMKGGVAPDSIMKKYYGELVEHSKTIWEVLENQKEMIGVLNDTNEALMNYRLNNIMKTLTIFSVIVFPLTLLAAIFGMNTLDGMPFINIPNGFWIVIAIMITGCFGMLIFFKKKKWL